MNLYYLNIHNLSWNLSIFVTLTTIIKNIGIVAGSTLILRSHIAVKWEVHRGRMAGVPNY